MLMEYLLPGGWVPALHVQVYPARTMSPMPRQLVMNQSYFSPFKYNLSFIAAHILHQD